MQPCKGDSLLLYKHLKLYFFFFFFDLFLHVCCLFVENDQADVGGNEPSVSSYLPVEIEKDTGHRISKCIMQLW